MKAFVYHGPGKKKFDEMPKPALQAATDAIVRLSKTTICGTDLHILKGTSPPSPKVVFSGTRESASSRKRGPGKVIPTNREVVPKVG